jgi:hypothetical protein
LFGSEKVMSPQDEYPDGIGDGFSAVVWIDI